MTGSSGPAFAADVRPGYGSAGEAVPPRFRLALLPDFPEEGWPSMDLCAEMLASHWPELGGLTVVRPCFRKVFSGVVGSACRWAWNADRLANRLLVYPRFLRRMGDRFDAYHVVDHSYAAVVHALPAERTGVYCHDLDAFRCLLEPRRDPRPLWFRRYARYLLAGLQRAGVVFHSTQAVRQEILRYGLIAPERLVQAPYGVPPEFAPASACPPEREGGPSPRQPYLLHVGSCIPRKRIDVLLRVFAGVRQQFPQMSLVQAGGTWTADQVQLLSQLGMGDAVRQYRHLSRAALAELYRGASAVLLPSETEGFGMPVLEALACGTAVIASDLPSLREVGAAAVVYAPVGDVAAWVERVVALVQQPQTAPPVQERLAQAARFSCQAQARRIYDTYARLLGSHG
jgi:glycosyltransferase involved in cell wall biosynthesis